MKKKVSLKDIAAKLNVSTTTVSWVLSGKGTERKISAQMQEKIKALASEMNYESNMLARGLSLGYTKTLGLIVSDISNIFYAEVAHAIEKEAAKYGYHIIFCSSEDDPVREKELIRMLKSQCVDGIIISPTKKEKKEIVALAKEDYPLVLIDRYFPELNVNSVVVDNFNGTYELINHMIESGSRKIGLISTANHLLIMGQRIEGYKKALNAAGIRVDKDWIKSIELHNKDRREEIKKAIIDLISPPNRVEAIFFTTHFLAIQAYSILKEMNMKIPNSVGVACFDYFHYFEALDPSLTGVAQPIEAIGQTAVRLLTTQIKDRSVPKQQIVLPTTLVKGNSC